MIYTGDITGILKKIKHIMIDKNLNITILADNMNKSKQTISNLLNGRQPNMTLETLLALCEAMDCQLTIDIVPKDDTKKE